MNTDSNNLSKPADKKDDDEIDLLALFLVLLRGWKTIVLLAFIGLVLGILYSRYVNPTFQSDALIQIEENARGVSALGENISELLGSEASKAQTEAELIRSRMILEPVVDLLHLEISLIDPTIGFLDRIAVDKTNTQIYNSEGVSLNTDEGKAQVSQFEVSDAYLNQPFMLTRASTGFILSNEDESFKGQMGQTQTFRGMNGTIKATVNELPASTKAIEIVDHSLHNTIQAINEKLEVTEKGDKTGIIALSMTGSNQKQVGLILKQIVQSYVDQNQARGSEETTKTLTFMETQIPELKKKLEESEAVFNEFRKKYGTIDVSKEAELLLTENARIDVQLNELKLKKADLTTYYTEEHPLVIQINDQLEVLNNRQQEIDNTISGLPEIQREFLQLSEDVGIDREIYLSLLKNYQQLQIAKAGQVGYARIIDLPINNFNPIAPNKPMMWIIAILLGALLGSIAVLIKSMLRNVVKDPDTIEIKTGVQVIATIPRSPSLTRLNKIKKSQSRLLAYADNNSLSYEAVKSLRTSLMFAMPTKGKIGLRAKVIVITGESPGVGKSFISSNLSEVFAQLDKKVLIIDADMRLGELHKVFNMSQDNGLADYLDQTSFSLVDVVHPTVIDNVDFIPRGKEPRNPTSLLSTDRFSNLMDELNEHYDYIVIDSPPVLAASDAIIMSRYADKVLMVTRYDKSVEGQLIYAIKQLHKANVDVDGIILNDVQQGIMGKYSYHYNYAYGANN